MNEKVAIWLLGEVISGNVIGDLVVTYEQLVTAVLVFVALCTFIVLLNNTRKAVTDMNRPFSDLKQKVSEHEEEIAKRDKRIERQDDAIKILLSNDLLIMQHLAYGNHNEQLKNQISAVQEFLIEER